MTVGADCIPLSLDSFEYDVDVSVIDAEACMKSELYKIEHGIATNEIVDMYSSEDVIEKFTGVFLWF